MLTLPLNKGQGGYQSALCGALALLARYFIIESLIAACGRGDTGGSALAPPRKAMRETTWNPSYRYTV